MKRIRRRILIISSISAIVTISLIATSFLLMFSSDPAVMNFQFHSQKVDLSPRSSISIIILSINILVQVLDIKKYMEEQVMLSNFVRKATKAIANEKNEDNENL